jgi:hypothetical protein
MNYGIHCIASEKNRDKPIYKMKKPNTLQLAAISLLLPFVISCNSHSGSARNKLAVLKFNRHELVDKDGTGLVAATYLVPDGWKVEDKIEWNIHNVAQPAIAELYILDEESNSAMQGFPNLVFLVNKDVNMREEYPEGSSFMGAEVINQKPGVLDLIENYILPEYRNIEGLKIIESKRLSVAASNHKRAGEFKNTDSKSGVVKIEYTENGKDFEEAIFGTITFIPVSKYQQFACLSMCYGCRTVKGNLKSTMGIFETILNSVKMNAKWAVTYNQVMKFAMQDAMRGSSNDGEYDEDGDSYGDHYGESGGENGNYGDNYETGEDDYGDYGDDNAGTDGGNYNGGNYSGGVSTAGNVGSLSNYFQQANESINEGIIQRYENEQLSNDRIAEGYSDYTLGYQNYTDPNTGEVLKLSSGYENAWTDNNGSVVLSNDAGYDPNVGGSSSWSSLEAGGSTVAAPAAATETE